MYSDSEESDSPSDEEGEEEEEDDAVGGVVGLSKPTQQKREHTRVQGATRVAAQQGVRVLPRASGYILQGRVCWHVRRTTDVSDALGMT
jgi:hypothetical protein